jgi:dihydroxycyclohexadiene carboxylate dehydrogenase
MEYSGHGIRINATAPGGTEAPARLTPRNQETPSLQEQRWYQQVVDQTKESSLMHRYGMLAEQANAILFLASDDASYITGTILPVGGGDLG